MPGLSSVQSLCFRRLQEQLSAQIFPCSLLSYVHSYSGVDKTGQQHLKAKADLACLSSLFHIAKSFRCILKREGTINDWMQMMQRNRSVHRLKQGRVGAWGVLQG